MLVSAKCDAIVWSWAAEYAPEAVRPKALNVVAELFPVGKKGPKRTDEKMQRATQWSGETWGTV